MTTMSSFPVSSSVPAPSAFADFRFSVIGKQPQLLQRISATDSNFFAHSPSPTPERNLQHPPHLSSQPPSRPSLLNVLSAQVHPPDLSTTNATNEVEMDVDRDLIPVQNRSIRSTNSAPDHLGSVEQPDDDPLLFRSDSESQRNLAPISSFPSPEMCSVPDPSLNIDASDFTALRTIQSRLQSKISEFSLRDPAEAVLAVEKANSKAAHALSMANKAYTLAQQALTSAAESLTAAQHCLRAAEEADSFASNAATVVEQLTVYGGGSGSARSQGKSAISGLQDDLCALGEWAGQMEAYENSRRRQAASIEPHGRIKVAVESGRGSSTELQHFSMGVGTGPDTKTNADGRHPSPAANVVEGRDNSAETGCDDLRETSSSERHVVAVPPGSQQNVESFHKEAQGIVESSSQPLQSDLTRHDEHPAQWQQDAAGTPPQPIRDVEKEKFEISIFRTLEREQRKKSGAKEDVQHRDASADERLERQSLSLPNSKLDDIEQTKDQPRLDEWRQSSEARRPEELNNAEAGELVRKARELEELRQKHEAEKAAELEADARECELRAEQERRRQEVMEEKQRANAETAARIRAKRAKEIKTIGSTTTALTSPEPQLQTADSVVAKQSIIATTPCKPAKPRSFSGGKLGLSADQQPLPSPTPSRSAAPGSYHHKSPVVALSKNPATALPHKQGDRTSTETSHDVLAKAVSQKLSREGSPGINAATIPPMFQVSPSSASPNGVLASPAKEDVYENICVHGRSQDPGNLPVISNYMTLHTLPQVQAANLRFVGGTNDTLLDTYLRPLNPQVVKTEPLAEISLANNVTPPNSMRTPTDKADSELQYPSLLKDDPSPSSPSSSTSRSDINNVQRMPVDTDSTRNGVERSAHLSLEPAKTRSTTSFTSSPAGPSPSTIEPLKLLLRSPSDREIIPPRKRMGDPAKTLPSTAPRGRNPSGNGSKARRYDHYPPIRQMDHYSPPPRDVHQLDRRPNSPLSPPRTSYWGRDTMVEVRPPPLGPPILGKRRNPDDVPLEPPVHRHWQAAKSQGNHFYATRSTTRPPSPDRVMALGSRIGGRDPNTSGDRSYRPLYSPDRLLPPTQPRQTADTYHHGIQQVQTSPAIPHMPLGRHQVMDSRPRRSLLNRGGKPASAGGSGRGRGSRNPSRPLEQRISSHTATTLIDRLESSQH